MPSKIPPTKPVYFFARDDGQAWRFLSSNRITHWSRLWSELVFAHLAAGSIPSGAIVYILPRAFRERPAEYAKVIERGPFRVLSEDVVDGVVDYDFDNGRVRCSADARDERIKDLETKLAEAEGRAVRAAYDANDARHAVSAAEDRCALLRQRISNLENLTVPVGRNDDVAINNLSHQVDELVRACQTACDAVRGSIKPGNAPTKSEPVYVLAKDAKQALAFAGVNDLRLFKCVDSLADTPESTVGKVLYWLPRDDREDADWRHTTWRMRGGAVRVVGGSLKLKGTP